MRSVLLVLTLVALVGCGSDEGRPNWFRISGEAGIGPTLNASDIAPESARATTDPVTGEPVFYFRFTKSGVQKFHQLTRLLAHRGARTGRPFHSVIRVDGRVIARPSIDYHAYPNGVQGDNGVQLNPRSRSESEKLARRLRGP
jgi:preprotein translocase subunit SecD